jgi:hypothetical protein
MQTGVGADIGLLSGCAPLRLQARLGLVKPDRPQVARRAVMVAAAGWGFLGVLATVLGDSPLENLRSFLSDFGVMARSLIAAPVFILAETTTAPRLGAIAGMFTTAGLVPETERERFDAAVASTRRLRDSVWAEIGILIVVAATILALVRLTPAAMVPEWHRAGDAGAPVFSAAGWWHVFVSLPLLLTLFLAWVWRFGLWARFLWIVSRLELRLVPSHPDRAAGVKFLGLSVRAFGIVSFALGAVVAGRVANAIAHQGLSLAQHKYTIVGAVLFCVAVFTAPLLTFTGRLLREWWYGVFAYGALASGFGRQFEHRWTERRALWDETILERPDFSAATDLYQVADRVYTMRFVPVDLQSLVFLIVATLLPFVPVALATIPFDVIVAGVAGLLF